MIVCGFFVACDLKGDFISLWELACQRWRPYRRPCFGWLCEYPFLRVLRLAVSPLRRLTFLQAPKKVSKKRLPQRSAHSLGLGVPSFRDPSGRIVSGLLRCTSSRCVWLRQTVAALPPPDESLHSASRRGGWIKIKSCSRANAHPVEWWKSMGSAFVLCWGCPSSERRPPSPLPRGEGTDFWAFQA